MRYAGVCATFLSVAVIGVQSSVAADTSTWRTVREIAAPEAHQAAAADERFVYTIASRQVAKYDRRTGKRVAVSSGDAKHLNSGFLWQGRLLCAHSNYPQTPEQSEIKVLDPESMELSTFRDFGNYGGSLVWVTRHHDHWWCNFARYGEKNAETFLARFNNDWKETGRWTYPESVIRHLGRYSLSGGLWFGDELLTTGHDKQELYRLHLPSTGSELEFVGREDVPFTGQGFAVDSATGGLVGISRAERKVIFVERNISPERVPEITHGPFIGHVTPDTAIIWARFSEPGEYQLTVRDGNDTETKVRATAASTSDGCLHWQISNLSPATRYRYEVRSVDELLLNDTNCFFETASKAPALVRIAFGSCAREDEGSAAVWRRMRQVDPHAVVLLGDTPYIDSTDLDVQRKRHREFAAVPDFRRLVRNRSLYATWDDHDFGRNDTNGVLPGKENSRRAFTEYRANPSFGDGKQGIYTKFRRGGVEVFLLDTRFFAATETSPFDAMKPSLLGKAQWQWLQRDLKASTAPFKVLACGMIWNKAVRPGKQDHWGTYPHERDALFDFIGREKISGVVLIGGDIHRTRVLRHHSTEQAGYQIPELITSPVHDGVIANAKQPHTALIHDSGEPNSFLLLTGDDRATSAELTASFQNSAGRELYSLKVTDRDLK